MLVQFQYKRRVLLAGIASQQRACAPSQSIRVYCVGPRPLTSHNVVATKPSQESRAVGHLYSSIYCWSGAMGAYLSAPVTAKQSAHGRAVIGEREIAFGSTAMQGWRVGMEV